MGIVFVVLSSLMFLCDSTHKSADRRRTSQQESTAAGDH